MTHPTKGFPEMTERSVLLAAAQPLCRQALQTVLAFHCLAVVA